MGIGVLWTALFAGLALIVSPMPSAVAGRPDVRHEAYHARSSVAVAVADATVGTAFEYAGFVASDGTRLPYRLMAPASPAPDGRYPLVVLLHGSGAMGTDNEMQIGAFARSWADPELRKRFPAYVLVPQVAARSADYRPGADGLLASSPGVSLKAVLELVDSFRARPGIDRQRIYLVGFSMGGSAALNALLERQEYFAAVIAFSPVPPQRGLAARVSSVPMLLVHGSADEENPYPADRAWAQAVADAGGRPIFIVIDGMAHEFPQQMLVRHDWRRWLFARRLRPKGDQ
jgi:predicted peptidase